MILQSIVVYNSLIFFLVSFAKLYLAEVSKLKSKKIKGTNSQNGVFYLAIIILFFSVSMGIRYDVGTDYLNYLEGYIYNYDVGKGEILFESIRELFNKYKLHYAVYFSFLAFLNISFFIYAFKKEAFILPLLLFFLFTNGDWMFWMNGIRQAIAMCIWIYALNFIKQEKKWWYLFWCVVSIGFHTSAIILIPLYIILNNGKDYFKSIVLQLTFFFGAFIIQLLFGTFLLQIEPFISYYQTELTGGVYNYSMDRIEEEASSTVKGSGLAYLFKLALTVIIILMSKKLKLYYNNKWFTIVYFLFFIGVFIQNIFPIGSVVATRPFRYFFIFKGVMFAYFVYYLLKHKSPYYRLFGIILIITFIAIFNLNIITSNINSHLWFQFFFNAT